MGTKKNEGESVEHRPVEVNVRRVYGLRSIGKGFAGGRMLCAMLDLPTPPQKFIRLSNMISPVVETVAKESM